MDLEPFNEPSGTDLQDESTALHVPAAPMTPSAAPAAGTSPTLVTQRAELPAGYPPVGASSVKVRQDSLSI